MERERRSRPIIVSQLLLILAMVAWLAITLQSKSSMRDALDREKLHSEALLSEKLLTEKALHKTRQKNAALESGNGILQQSLNEKTRLASRQEATNHRLRKTADHYRKELENKCDTILDLKAKLKNMTEHYTREKALWKATADSLQYIHEERQYLKDGSDATIRRTLDQLLITSLRKNIR